LQDQVDYYNPTSVTDAIMAHVKGVFCYQMLDDLGLTSDERTAKEATVREKLAVAKAEAEAKNARIREELAKALADRGGTIRRSQSRAGRELHSGEIFERSSSLARLRSIEPSSPQLPLADYQGPVPLDYGPLGASDPDLMDEAEVAPTVFVCQACAIKASELEDLKRAYQEVLDKEAELERENAEYKERDAFQTAQNATFQTMFATLGNLEEIKAKIASQDAQVCSLVKEKTALENQVQSLEQTLLGENNRPMSTGISDMLEVAGLGDASE